MSNGGSRVWLFHGDGGVDFPYVDQNFTVFAAQESPSGTVWVVGSTNDSSNSTVLKFKPTTNEIETVKLNSEAWPLHWFASVVPVSDDDVWFADWYGYLWHLSSSGFDVVETGTRSTPSRLVLTREPNGHSSLWLVGSFGMILHKSL